MENKQRGKLFFPKKVFLMTSLIVGFGSTLIAGSNSSKFESSTNISQAVQQQKKIKGTIVDNTGEPVIGASVVVKGTTNGTVTDIDGNFTLDVPADAVLRITFVGYISQEIKVGSQSKFDIKLQEDAKNLEEVVVVGYGVQKKVNLSGAVAAVKMDELVQSRPVTNISNGLAGLAAGVQVNAGSNRPGSDNSTIMIRGQGTLNNAEPLVIIDGVESNISSVNPQDIENLSVLKDAASAAIYGSRAANGVILITTKQGKQGKVKIDYNGYVSFESIGHTLKMVNNYANYMELMNEGRSNSGLTPLFSKENIDLWRKNENGNQLLYPNTDWVKETFKTSVATNHNVSLSGGTDKIRFFSSFGYLNNPGVMENSGYERFSMRTNLEADVKPWLKLGTNLNGYVSETQPGTKNIDDVFTFSGATTPGMVLRSPDGRYGAMNNLEDNAQSANNNPLKRLNSIDGRYKQRNMKTRFFGTLTPMKGLSFTGSYTYEFTDEINETKPVFLDGWNFLTNTITSAGKGRTSIFNKNLKIQRNLMDGVLRYETKFNKLDLSAMAGASQEMYQHQFFQATRQDLIDPDLEVIGGAVGPSTTDGEKVEWAMQSYFARVNLGWDNKYLLELNFRADGSSRFLKNERWGYFPSVSAAWRIDQEEFMEPLSSTWLSNLKFRASYGALGNNCVAASSDPSKGNYEALSRYGISNYILNNNLMMGLATKNIANALLTWEKTKIADIGIDFGMLNNRLSGTIDYFHKNTTDILIELPAPLVNGAAKIPTQNAGAVVNKGLEFSLGWQDKIGDFSYYVNGNLTWIKNEVTKFKGDNYSIKDNGIIKEGLPIMAQYGRIVDRIIQTDADLALVQKIMDNAPIKDPKTGERENPFAGGKRPEKGDILYKDMNGDGFINDDDRVPIGNGPNPKFTYGLNLGASYKFVDFSMLFQGVSGVKMYWVDDNFTPNIRWGYQINQEIADGRWTDGRTDAQYPRLLDISDGRNKHVSDLWIQDKSYLKIKNIQIGFTVPQKALSKFNIEKLRIYGSLENFFTFTKYKGLDPEVKNTSYPSMKQAVVGLNLTF